MSPLPNAPGAELDGGTPGLPGRTVVELVVTGIRRAILAGDILPGERLVETALAQQFGGSRATARAACITLEGEGIVERLHNRGARVRQVTLQEAIELTEVRMALEGICAAKAAVRATDEELRELRELGTQLQALVVDDDDVGYTEVNGRLHRRIVEISGHRVAAELVNLARARSAVTHQFRIGLRPRRLATSLQEHLDLIAALGRRDSGEAEAAMRQHLSAVRDSLESRSASARAQQAR